MERSLTNTISFVIYIYAFAIRLKFHVSWFQVRKENMGKFIIIVSVDRILAQIITILKVHILNVYSYWARCTVMFTSQIAMFTTKWHFIKQSSMPYQLNEHYNCLFPCTYIDFQCSRSHNLVFVIDALAYHHIQTVIYHEKWIISFLANQTTCRLTKVRTFIHLGLTKAFVFSNKKIVSSQVNRDALSSSGW